jgi:AraC family transcriptional regulator, transcriptional activator of pobA
MKRKSIPVYNITDVAIGDKIPYFEVLSLEAAFEKAKQNVVGPHRHDFYETFILSGGEGAISIDFEDYPLAVPQLLFFAPGRVHSWEKARNRSGMMIRFSSEFLLSGEMDTTYSPELYIFITIGGSPVIHLQREQFEKFHSIARMMESEYLISRLSREEALRAYLRLWLIESLRIANDLRMMSLDDKSAPLARRFLSLVETDFLKNASVSDYARQLHVTTGHLCESIRKTINRSAGEVIRSRILIEAKRLLRYTDMSVSEIAYYLNFEDPSYFARYFRKHCLMCPSEFRYTKPQ